MHVRREEQGGVTHTVHPSGSATPCARVSPLVCHCTSCVTHCLGHHVHREAQGSVTHKVHPRGSVAPCTQESPLVCHCHCTMLLQSKAEELADRGRQKLKQGSGR